MCAVRCSHRDTFTFTVERLRYMHKFIHCSYTVLTLVFKNSFTILEFTSNALCFLHAVCSWSDLCSLLLLYNACYLLECYKISPMLRRRSLLDALGASMLRGAVLGLSSAGRGAVMGRGSSSRALIFV